METQIGNLIFIDEGQIEELKLKGEQFYEQWMLDNIQKLPYRPGIWIDVGAHVGNHTVYFSTRCHADEVWAYEPTPETFEILKRNLENNNGNTVRLFNCAVGAKKTNCRLKTKTRSGQNSVTYQKGSVPMEVLGDISAKVALIKIDVEGFEFEVLKGAMPVIERDLPELFVETFEHVEKLIEILPVSYRLVATYNNAPTYHLTSNNSI